MPECRHHHPCSPANKLLQIFGEISTPPPGTVLLMFQIEFDWWNALDAGYGTLNSGINTWNILIWSFGSFWLLLATSCYPNTHEKAHNIIRVYCIRIRTRGGIYGQIYPSAWRSSQGWSPRELLKAEGYIWSYIPSRFLIRTLYHFIRHFNNFDH